MKSLHKKICAIALSGMISGVYLSNAVIIYSDFIIDPSSGRPVPIVPLEDKFNPDLYPKKYPELKVEKEYIYRIFKKGDVVVKGNNYGIDELYKALKGSGFEHIKCSGKPGVIDDFVKDSNEDILKDKSQLAFKNIDMFRKYINDLSNKPKPEEGVYRFMIGGFDGLFYFNPRGLINMFDEVKINLQYILRGEKKYGYEVLEYNLENHPILKKYKEPMIFYSVDEFFKKMNPDIRKRPGMFGGKHGGIHEGGIYCAQIGDLVFLFRALE